MQALIKITSAVAVGVGAAVTCWWLKKSGKHVAVAQSVSKAGSAVTDVAVVATMAAIDLGSAATQATIDTAEAAAELATNGVETVGYGLGRGARAVLDVTSRAGNACSGNNPLSRGVQRGFYAADAEAVEVVDGLVLSNS